MALWSGFTPNKYAATADQGAGDGTSEANAMDFPTALSGLSAGDVLGVLPGVYSAAVGSNDTPLFTPGASGTSGSPIRVVCKYPAAYLSEPSSDANRTELRVTGATPASATTSPVLGSGQNKQYCRYYGFYANQATAPARPSGGTFTVQSGATSTHFEECVVDMDIPAHDDNYPAIWSAGNAGPTFRNCKFRNGNGDLTAGGFMPAFTFYGTVGVLITHCDFTDLDAGVYFKGSVNNPGRTLSDGVIEYCKFSGLRKYCIVVNEANVAAWPVARYNLAINCPQFMHLHGGTANATEKNFEAYNNTIVNPNDILADGTFYAAGLTTDFQANDCAWWNNIVARISAPSGQAYLVNLGGSEPDPTATFNTVGFDPFDYNCYYQVSATKRWVTNGSTVNNFAAWQSAVQADVAAHESHSIEQDPLFENAGSGDYRLASGSPCRNAGLGGIHMGCYLTGNETIGVQAAGSATRRLAFMRA
jgi:hypothetical protein